ncbi:MAG: DUF2889 domain-containing protein [Halioglobus sp.]|nr:DUF2889 domain-containing protein [Halioglobus sp.]
MSNYPTNPDYGGGVYRRRVRLVNSAGQVCGELEDDCHGFRVQLQHDGSVVTGVSGSALRVPMSTCGQAIKPLQALVGIALDAPLPEVVASVRPRGNCTHWLDLALLALAHARRDDAERIYDVEVDDQAADSSPARAEVFLDGESVHRWMLDGTTVVKPQAFAGNPMLKGFSAWANKAFDGDEREAALLLSKGFFVALSRRFDMSNSSGQSALEHTNMRGACYTYSEGVMERAVRNHDVVRDFSATPEQLLTFR